MKIPEIHPISFTIVFLSICTGVIENYKTGECFIQAACVRLFENEKENQRRIVVHSRNIIGWINLMHNLDVSSS